MCTHVCARIRDGVHTYMCMTGGPHESTYTRTRVALPISRSEVHVLSLRKLNTCGELFGAFFDLNMVVPVLLPPLPPTLPPVDAV